MELFVFKAYIKKLTPEFDSILGVIRERKIEIQIYILVPISNQGSGKTFFYREIIAPFFRHQSKNTLKLLSSKRVNEKLTLAYISEYLQGSEFPNKEHDSMDSLKQTGFQNSRRSYRTAYRVETDEIFREIYVEAIERHDKGEREEMRFFLFVDKNHPLNRTSHFRLKEKYIDCSERLGLKFVSLDVQAAQKECKTSEEEIEELSE